MKITELKRWNDLTPEEQARLRDVYQVDENDNLPESITKTMANSSPTGQEEGGSQ
jgi:hypothetical protein